jgi:hypothetical protein
MITTAASETVKLKDSTRCLLDRPSDVIRERELGGEQSRREELGRASRVKSRQTNR